MGFMCCNAPQCMGKYSSLYRHDRDWLLMNFVEGGP